jgi:hypothetical protein
MAMSLSCRGLGFSYRVRVWKICEVVGVRLYEVGER